jgi:hypothetical protein
MYSNNIFATGLVESALEEGKFIDVVRRAWCGTKYTELYIVQRNIWGR